MVDHPPASAARPAETGPTRRRVVIVATLLAGTALLAATLRVPRGSGWFTILGLPLAGVWIAGAVIAGPSPFVPPLWPEPSRSLLIAIGIGGVTFLGFVVAVQIGRHLPIVSPALTNVLSKADAGPSGLVVAVAVVNGIGEELFFRGPLHAAAPNQPVMFTTGIYVAVTAATGNIALVAAAVVMGTILGFQRNATGGVVSPAVTHVTWSTLMLVALPR